MLTRDECFTVVSLTLGIIGLALSVFTTVFAYSGYGQATVNTEALDAQIKAQRIMLQASLQAPAGSLGVGVGGGGGVHADAAREALAALQAYRVRGEE